MVAAYCLLPTVNCLLIRGQRTGMKGAGVLDGVRAFFNVTDDAVLVDHEGNAIGEQAGEAQDAVGFGDDFIGVAKQGKAGAGFFGKLAVPLLGIKTDSQNLRACGLEFGDIRLISLDLASSTRSGGARVKRQDHGFFAVEIRKLHELAVLVGQREIRSAVAHL